MSARPAPGGRGLVASALAAAADWLIEPAEPAAPQGSSAAPDARPVVAVVGLSARCGSTTVARALGAELAARDPGSACAVTSARAPGAVPLGLPAAARLTRTLSPLAGAGTRLCGRLFLFDTHDRAGLAEAARYLAPLILDVEDTSEASGAAALADHVLLIGSPATEPALATVIAESLRRVGPDPVVVLNRPAGEVERWDGRVAMTLPESRVGAQLALAGREPRGRLGRAIAELADRCEEGAAGRNA
ncbi:MAG: hypothetical protein ACR2FZ_05440 [Thermoleophilaceae bacterium]